MTTKWIILGIAALLLSSGCAKPARKAESLISSIGAERLRQAAAETQPLSKTEQFRKSAPYLDHSQWPEIFKPFKPVEISLDDYSVMIIQRKFVSHWEGVLIVPAGSGYKPQTASNLKVEQLAEGIYYFWI